MEEVILVDENDLELGYIEKMEAHEKGLLHRAFSVFLFNERDEMLIQKRAMTKYHSGGLWTNTCCSHPRPQEETIVAAKRRLKEEMGIEAEIREIFDFKYRAELDHNLIEHEYDHVFFGIHSGDIKLNINEAEDFKFVALNDLSREINEHPEHYTEWFKIALPKVIDHFSTVRSE